MIRRRVRVAGSFFEQLDELFGPERGTAGQPSGTDFILFELPDVVERVVQSGLLVHAYAVYGLLMPDDAIELVGLTVETRG